MNPNGIPIKLLDFCLDLDFSRRRTNAKRRREAGRLGGGIRRRDENCADKQRSGAVWSTPDNPGVGYGADGTFMTGNLGACRVDVDHLHGPNERNEDYASER
jgi:hypothetical protein